MSHTDKTDPYWVKAWNYGKVRHVIDCDETCEPFHNWTYRGCCYRIEGKYSYQVSLDKPKSASEYCNLRERSARNSTRLALRNVILYEEFEDADVPDTKHRHSALWDMY